MRRQLTETMSREAFALIARPMTFEEYADHVAGYQQSTYRRGEAWARERGREVGGMGPEPTARRWRVPKVAANEAATARRAA